MAFTCSRLVSSLGVTPESGESHASFSLFAVGSADGSEPGVGGYAACEALVRDNAKLVVVFCSESQDLPAVVGQICAAFSGVPLIGCTTAGEIATSGPVRPVSLSPL
jgi:FIST N domain